MFNYTILTDTERTEDVYTYFNVEFSDGDESFIEEYRTWNENNVMELESLKASHFINRINSLEIIKQQYGKIYNTNGLLNIQKNNTI